MKQFTENRVVRYKGDFYLVEGNSIRKIPDLAGFFNGRYKISQGIATSVLQEFRPTQDIEKLEEPGFKKYELGKPLEPEYTPIPFYADDFLGAGRWMETRGEMSREGALFAVTKIETVVCFGGGVFHAAAGVLMTDNDQVPVAFCMHRITRDEWFCTLIRYERLIRLMQLLQLLTA